MSIKKQLLEMSERLSRVGGQAACPVEVMLIAAEMKGLANGMTEQQPPQQHLYDEDAKHKAQLQKLEAARLARKEEVTGSRMVEVVGGPAGDSSVLIEGKVPEGAFTSIAGACYQFREGTLHHYQPQTNPK